MPLAIGQVVWRCEWQKQEAEDVEGVSSPGIHFVPASHSGRSRRRLLQEAPGLSLTGPAAWLRTGPIPHWYAIVIPIWYSPTR